MKERFDKGRILHQDDACLVVNKACGEAMEGAGKDAVDLPVLLAEAVGSGLTSEGKVFLPTAVHRIDVPVTGCALFARTPAALAFLNSCFADGRARKTYWAVVEPPRDGAAPVEAAELVHWIAVDGKHNKSYAHDQELRDRKRAVLRYRIVGRGERYLFLEVELITGRHHQIRAQLAAAGMVIKGDLKYGARRSEQGGGIRLHARSLAFPDPQAVDSPTPPYIQTLAPLPVEDALWAAFQAACQGR